MRMRRKPWARPELEACGFFIDNPLDFRSKWNTAFDKKNPLHIELGCGKGTFVAEAALKNPGVNFLAIDIKSEMLAVGRRTIVKKFEDNSKEISNILLTAHNIEQIELILSENDHADRIYINFCNPWPREKHKKRRLTHPRQLEKYRVFLKNGGEIHFKTDDLPLFEDSLDYFTLCEFRITYKTNDLHSENLNDNIITEHETMFTEEGKKISYCIAVR